MSDVCYHDFIYADNWFPDGAATIVIIVIMYDDYIESPSNFNFQESFV